MQADETMNKSLRILVVDDDRVSARVMVEELADAGYSARAVDSAFRALELLKEVNKTGVI